MKKPYLVVTLFLLLSICLVIQASGQQPASNQPAAAPVAAQTQAALPAAPAHDILIEGCLGGSSGRFTLTDAAGKVYPLRGDTGQLSEHVGQQASITGLEQPETTSAGAAQSTFTVKKVKFIGRACETSK
jgi:hypothetical protein